MPQIVYSHEYNMGIPWMQRLHPFDLRKFGKAWRILQDEFSEQLSRWHLPVDRPANREELATVHSEEYFDQLKDSAYLAKAFETPAAARLPAMLLDRYILNPMRWATRGTVLAARSAVEQGMAINLGGGFHHAKRDKAEDFCVYSDIALAIHDLRKQELIADDDQIVYIDLDAHQGNGVCHQFLNDRRVLIYDQYNSEIYPCSDTTALERIDGNIPLPFGCDGDRYLLLLQRGLPDFLDLATENGPVALAIYNAGTDPFIGDNLGMLQLKATEILERDLFVAAQFRERKIPWLFLTSGGYSQESYRLIATSVMELLRRE